MNRLKLCEENILCITTSVERQEAVVLTLKQFEKTIRNKITKDISQSWI